MKTIFQTIRCIFIKIVYICSVKIQIYTIMRTRTKNGIKQFINSKEVLCFKFRPTRRFYYLTQIRQKRWGQIYRDEKPATIDELQRIANFFNVDINTFLSSNENN